MSWKEVEVRTYPLDRNPVFRRLVLELGDPFANPSIAWLRMEWPDLDEYLDNVECAACGSTKDAETCVVCAATYCLCGIALLDCPKDSRSGDWFCDEDMPDHGSCPECSDYDPHDMED